jgi:wobble nucleotide-excising tRNase
MNELEGLIPVEGKEGLYRDPSSNAIVKGNIDEYDKYMASYNKRQKEDAEKKALQKEVSDLKSEMSDIKSLLLTLVQNQSKHYDD